MEYTNHQKNFQSSRDKTNIFYQSWLKPDSKKVVVLQHGFGEHSGRYGNIIDTLKDESISFYALDSRGHGKSDGKRGHVDQFQYYIDDLADLIRIVKNENKDSKIVLLGHSLGGVIALQYATEGSNQDYLAGIVISSPGLRIKMDLEKQIKKVAAEFLSSIMPAFTMDANLDINLLSHDKNVVLAYKNDPLVHGKVSFQMGKNLFHLGKMLKSKAHLIKIPIFMLHGDQDGIADMEGTREFFQNLTCKDTDLKIYPGLFHETMNELPEHKAIVLSDIKKFIVKV